MDIRRKIASKIMALVTYIYHKRNFEFSLFFCIMVCIRVLQICYKIKGLNFGFIILLFFCGIVLYIFFNKVLNKLRLKLLFCFIVFLALCAAYYYKSEVFINYFKTAASYLQDINNGIIHSTNTYFYQYVPFLAIIIPFLTFLILCLKESHRMQGLIVVNCVFVIYLWYAGYDYDMKNYIVLYIIFNVFLYILASYTVSKRRLEFKKIKFAVDKERILAYGLILALIFGGVSSTLIRTIGVKSLPQIAREIKSKFLPFSEKNKESRYDLYFSGYNGNISTLGGPIYLNDHLAFKVKADRIYYLRGTVKEYYDGKSWTKNQNDFKNIDKTIVSNESIYFNRSLQLKRNDIPFNIELVKSNITIFPAELSTSTLFTPNYTHNVRTLKDFAAYDSTGSYIIANKSNMDSPYYIELSSFKNGDENFLDFYSLGADISGVSEVNRKKYEQYLQMPSNISTEIVKLVESITEGSRSNSEKIYKIREYLMKNYPYSLEVSALPNGNEFIDYFLFKEKKGYCTYFATTATIFCRIAGIPARYVEGFHMKDKKDDSGLYLVTNDMAHAWTEVLVMPESDIWCTLDCVPEQAEEQEKTKAINTTKLNQVAKKYNSPSSENIKGDNNSSYNEDRGKVFIKKFKVLNIRSIILLAAFILAAYIIICISYYMRRRKYILATRSSIPLYHHVMLRVSSLGYKRKENISDKEWVELIEIEELKGYLQVLTDITYKEFYGCQSVADFNKLTTLNNIEAIIKKNQKIMEYYFKKYFIWIKI